jgi:hypothetical protein
MARRTEVEIRAKIATLEKYASEFNLTTPTHAKIRALKWVIHEIEDGRQV